MADKKEPAPVGSPLFLEPGAYRERSGARPAGESEPPPSKPPPPKPPTPKRQPQAFRRPPVAATPPSVRTSPDSTSAASHEERILPTVRQPAPLTLRRLILPTLLFAATCASTFAVGGAAWPDKILAGPLYGAGLMTILLAHELGHFLVARHYRVPASLPFFIPMPFSPIGTMGAVIAMEPRVADRKALYDIAVAGPIAGLVPTLVFLVAGLRMSDISLNSKLYPPWLDGSPLLFQAVERWLVGSLTPMEGINYHPLAVAAWTGLLITALNLFPIGQLDGGHVLYTLLGSRARLVSRAILFACVGAVIAGGQRYWGWTLMLLLLMLMGSHPPTADDTVPLGRWRIWLGWALLAFVVIGFTPSPFGMR